MNFITPQEIRINAVLGVCARQRELIAENRRLNNQAIKLDIIAGYVGFATAFAILLACIIL